jgi:hypothetical protein
VIWPWPFAGLFQQLLAKLSTTQHPASPQVLVLEAIRRKPPAAGVSNALHSRHVAKSS